MKLWHLRVLVFATILIFGFLFSRDLLAREVWHRYGWADIALALVSRDAGLAAQIGNYYFNGTIGRSEYNLEKAERAYRKAVAADNKILWGHYQLSRIAFVKGDYEPALEEIAKELGANPENLRSLYVRGLIYGYRGQVGDLEKAEADFRRFTFWAPSEWAGYNDLAWILSKEAKYQDAKDAMLAALSKATYAERNPWLWNAKGLAELNLGEYKMSKESFKRAVPLADGLSLDDWRKSYPGNGPDSAESGLTAFREAIRSNLDKADSLLR